MYDLVMYSSDALISSSAVLQHDLVHEFIYIRMDSNRIFCSTCTSPTLGNYPQSQHLEGHTLHAHFLFFYFVVA